MPVTTAQFAGMLEPREYDDQQCVTAVRCFSAPPRRRVPEEKNMAGVILKDVVKVYENGVRVVDRFNMDIKDREFVTLWKFE